MTPPKRLWAGQQRYSRRQFDRHVAQAKRRTFVAVDPTSGKTCVYRHARVPTDAQAVAAVMGQAAELIDQ